MDILSSLTILIGLLLFASVSKRIEDSMLTAPILFVSFGFVFGPDALNFIRIDLSSEIVMTLAELTLVFVLFSDSSRISFAELRANASLPARLLGIGLPLTIVAGTGAALLLFSDLGLWGAALIGVVVAPTDAALGRAVVSSERVPEQVRRALNVESGLNDGICVPVLNSCILAAVAFAGFESVDSQTGFSVMFAQAIGLALLIGFGTAYFSARLLGPATRNGWVDEHWSMVGLLATPLLAYVLAEYAGGSGFIAAFVAGITMGNVRGRPPRATYVYVEASSELLSFFTWVAFGAAVVAGLFSAASITVLVYAILCLTVMRMLPVALSLAGTGLPWETRVFVGWFGPRGLASIVFAIVILNDPRITGVETIIDVVAWTLLLSVFAHGLTASAGARWLARRQRN